ncbi:hypothetical protein ACFLXG_00350 [Chloroflexota bacterium]
MKSGNLIVKLCEKAINYDGNACLEFLKEVADIEEATYKCLA